MDSRQDTITEYTSSRSKALSRLRLVMDMLPVGKTSSSVSIAARHLESSNADLLLIAEVPEENNLLLIMRDGRDDEISKAGDTAITVNADKHQVKDLASCLPKLAATANEIHISIIRGA